MGLDIGAIWGDVQDSVEKGFDDFWATGSTAVTAYLEGEAVKIIQGDQAKQTAAFQAAVTNIANRPSNGDGLGGWLQNQLASPAMKAYGLPIVLVIGVAIAAGFMLRKGK